jgi:hypothetical protein
MNRSLLLFLVLLIFSRFHGYSQDSEALQDLQVDVVYLASDYLEGRETGKRGEALAARYIADRFAEIGLQPKGTGYTFFQSFDFNYNPNPHGDASQGEARTGKNVVAYLDNGAATTVVIGAHYDHLGNGIPGSLHAGGPAIHNGADDNASGVAAMLRTAAYLQQGNATQNNYLFIAFSGEELGLFGSKNWINNPTIPLEEVNYMLNMDMVGRLNEEKVLVVNGAGTSPVWKKVLSEIDVDGISVKTSDSGVGPSDHTSFYLRDIPVLHFFTGQHEDYHKPADDPSDINFEGLLSVSDFVIALIEKLDDRGKLEFTKTKDESPERQAARFKVSLGVMPDYVYQGEGMRIDSVLDGLAAAEAGIKDGDIIIRIGDTEVTDIYSYMEGLSKFNKGDKTIVVVKRGEEVLEMAVTF